jgi:penicillin-binding protein 2
MQDKTHIRLRILRAVLLSLMFTLVGRLFYIQITSGEDFQQASQRNAFREVFTPSVRGLILDQVGRPVVANKSTVVISVNTRILESFEDKGESVISKLSSVLNIPTNEIKDRLTPCGTTDLLVWITFPTNPNCARCR